MNDGKTEKTQRKKPANARSAAAQQRAEEAAVAATEVLAMHGARGLTHRKVDSHLGWPEGSTSNYFRSRNELFAAAAAQIVRIDSSLLARLEADLAQADGITMDSFVDRVVELAMQWSAPAHQSLTLAGAEIMFESTRNPVVRSAAEGEINKISTWHIKSFESLGTDDPAAASEFFSLLMSSLLYGFSFTNNPPSESALRTLVRTWAQVSFDHGMSTQNDIDAYQ